MIKKSFIDKIEVIYNGGIIMKLVTYFQEKELHLGIKLEEGILPVNEKSDIDAPITIEELIHQGDLGINHLKKLIEKSTKDDYITEKVNYAPALTQPEKIICIRSEERRVGKEYRSRMSAYN